jgi:hypothetical protein
MKGTEPKSLHRFESHTLGEPPIMKILRTFVSTFLSVTALSGRGGGNVPSATPVQIGTGPAHHKHWPTFTCAGGEQSVGEPPA